MHGAEQYLVGIIEDSLGSVPVMAVNIQNENLLSLVDQFLCSDGNIIEEAKTVCPF